MCIEDTQNTYAKIDAVLVTQSLGTFLTEVSYPSIRHYKIVQYVDIQCTCQVFLCGLLRRIDSLIATVEVS